MIESINWIELGIIIGGYLLLLATSGVVVYSILSNISKDEEIRKKVDKRERDTGFVIGKCENILIVTFVFLDAYTALALIFAGKAIVRHEDMSKNTLYFLAGTMVNITYSILIALIIKALISFV